MYMKLLGRILSKTVDTLQRQICRKKKENGANVVSFTNIQGVPGYDYKAFSDRHGLPPFNIALATAKKELPNIDSTVSWMFRGIRNPKEGDTRGLYRGVFREMDISRVLVTRNNDFFQFG